MGDISLRDRCYKLIARIPRGRITTYKEVAEALGIKGYRLVGMFLSRNPRPVEIPCHRVVKSNGDVGGYIFGVEKKIELLRSEGIVVKNRKIENLQRYFFRLK
ncbi:MAG TPA: MGMT family protein [Methanococcaceae archaeon]|uniref:MGMT family protein n=1 Tax=Methanothermococcus okinawensis TaxID=155863 RepID=A0A833E3T2_9EURY|nr:MGMT family protein [Methanococcaceae archaeon]HIP91027.1 MGMT family protein [Methanothermococcus okinawensis]